MTTRSPRRRFSENLERLRDTLSFSRSPSALKRSKTVFLADEDHHGLVQSVSRSQPPPLELSVASPTPRIATSSPSIDLPQISSPFSDEVSPTVPEPPSEAHTGPKHPMSDVVVPELLQRGTPMTKVSAKKLKTIVLRLDADEGKITWESKKSGIIRIENIKELRSGADARYDREQFRLSMDYEDRWLTIVYMMDGRYKSLHTIASTKDTFHMWDMTLRKVFSIRQELMAGLGNTEMREALWTKQYFKTAGEQEEDHELRFEDVEKMCKRLNVNSSRQYLHEIFVEADVQKRGYLDFAGFQLFVKLLKRRPEMNRLYDRLRANGGNFFGFETFEKFMLTSQKSTLSSEELQVLFVKYATPLKVASPASTGSSAAGITPSDATSKNTSPPAPAAPAATTITATAEVASPATIPATIPTSPNFTSPAAAPNIPTATTDGSSDGKVASIDTTIPKVATTTTPTTAASPVTTTGTPEPATTLTTSSSHVASGSSLSLEMTLERFTVFLMSSDNSAFSDQHERVYHDMTRPLAEYYISSSHNTYLVGNQLRGVSTVEGYIRALLHSCRSVELDIYDGDMEPVVYHGKTLTTKVTAREICQAIAKYAFVVSPYPIIISAEIHCSLPQQDLLATILKSTLGPALVTGPINGKDIGEFDDLPSPEDLKGRILLKAKNLYVSSSEGLREHRVALGTESSSTETSASDAEPLQELRQEWGKVKKSEHMQELKSEFKKARGLFSERVKEMKAVAAGTSSHSNNLLTVSHIVHGTAATPALPAYLPPDPAGAIPKAPKQKTKMSMQLVGLLVYTVGVKCRGLNKKERYANCHLFSLSESTINKILKHSATDLIKHSRTHLVRIYPKGSRWDSTNYEPHRFWATGAQLVAINYQTVDLGFVINHAMFRRNGRAGYVLKPQALRIVDKDLLAKRTKHYFDVTIISAQQLPRPKDALGQEIIGTNIVDPYVEVSIHVPDWSNPANPPTTAASTVSQASASIAARSTTRSFPVPTYRTLAVMNNGFNPVWEEALSIPFEMVGGPSMRDLVFVRFTVRGSEDVDSEPLANYCASLGSLQEGFRHLPLLDTQLSQYLFSTLFVQISVRDV